MLDLKDGCRRVFCNRCNAENEIVTYCRNCGCPEMRLVRCGEPRAEKPKPARRRRLPK